MNVGENIDINKWFFNGKGNYPTLTNINHSITTGDVAIDISVQPHKQWVCLDASDPRNIIWGERITSHNIIKPASNKLTKDTEILIPKGSNRQQIQNIIDSVPNDFNGYELKLMFEGSGDVNNPNIYEVDAGIVFMCLQNGYLKVVTNTKITGEKKDVIIRPTSSWDPDTILGATGRSDISDFKCLFIFYKCDKISVRYIHFDCDTTIANGKVDGAASKNNNNTFHFYECTFTSPENSAYNYAIWSINGDNPIIINNYIGGFTYAIIMYNGSDGVASGNKPTTEIGKIKNNYLLNATGGCQMGFLNNTMSYSSGEYALGNGSIVVENNGQIFN